MGRPFQTHLLSAVAPRPHADSHTGLLLKRAVMASGVVGCGDPSFSHCQTPAGPVTIRLASGATSTRGVPSGSAASFRLSSSELGASEGCRLPLLASHSRLGFHLAFCWSTTLSPEAPSWCCGWPVPAIWLRKLWAILSLHPSAG